MKKIIILFIIFILSSFVIYKFNYKEDNIEVLKEENEVEKEFKSVFISYIDYSLLKGKSSDEQKIIIDEMIENISLFGLNNIILQVRPFADAIYESKYFLSSSKVVLKEGDKLELDILDYFIKKSHEKNISIYAWVNPYRIRNSNNIEDVGDNSLFKDWFGSEKIINNDEGIFFNPNNDEVLDLILNGIKEIVLNYDVDGILYDDYFYPDVDDDVDKVSVINELIKETNSIIKNNSDDVLFGISPSGNIESNLEEEYLDVNYIINNNYIDFIIPQIYYGFSNQYKPFIKTLEEWNNISNNINLYPALSLYKAGNVDKYAGVGSNEWIDNTDIIKKQIVVSRGYSNYKGFAIYRYSNLFIDNNDNLVKEIENIKSVMD